MLVGEKKPFLFKYLKFSIAFKQFYIFYLEILWLYFEIDQSLDQKKKTWSESNPHRKCLKFWIKRSLYYLKENHERYSSNSSWSGSSSQIKTLGVSIV